MRSKIELTNIPLTSWLLIACSALSAQASHKKSAEFLPVGALGQHSGGWYQALLPLTSEDLSTFAGYSTNSDQTSDWGEAYVWSSKLGLVGLGVLSPHTDGNRFSGAAAISADGDIVVGNSSNSDGVSNWQEAFLWSSEIGVVPLGTLGIHTTGERFSIASFISADGNIVAGTSSNSDGISNWIEGFVWDQKNGLVGIGRLSSDDSSPGFSVINQLSANGKFAVGESYNSTLGSSWIEAIRWSRQSGIQGLGVLSFHTDGNAYSTAKFVSRTGAVVYGDSSNSDGQFNWTEAFRWTQKEGLRGLGTLSNEPGEGYSKVLLMSESGDTVAGIYRNHNSAFGTAWDEAFVWSEQTGMLPIGVLSNSATNLGSSPNLISNDGRAVAGTSKNTDGLNEWDEAFIWTIEDGLKGLGSLDQHADGSRWSSVGAISGDGKVVGGHSSSIVDGHEVTEAFRWTKDGGMIRVSDWLGNGVDLHGVHLQQVLHLNHDGTVLAGHMSIDGGATLTPFWASRTHHCSSVSGKSSEANSCNRGAIVSGLQLQNHLESTIEDVAQQKQFNVISSIANASFSSRRASGTFSHSNPDTSVSTTFSSTYLDGNEIDSRPSAILESSAGKFGFVVSLTGLDTSQGPADDVTRTPIWSLAGWFVDATESLELTIGHEAMISGCGVNYIGDLNSCAQRSYGEFSHLSLHWRRMQALLGVTPHVTVYQAKFHEQERLIDFMGFNLNEISEAWHFSSVQIGASTELYHSGRWKVETLAAAAFQFDSEEPRSEMSILGLGVSDDRRKFINEQIGVLSGGVAWGDSEDGWLRVQSTAMLSGDSSSIEISAKYQIQF